MNYDIIISEGGAAASLKPEARIRNAEKYKSLHTY